MTDRFRATVGIFGLAILLVGLGSLALATVPPTSRGGWVKLSVCSKAPKAEDHEALLARLGTMGEIWARKTAIIGMQDEPGTPDCARITGANGKGFLVKGRADELVGVFQ